MPDSLDGAKRLVESPRFQRLSKEQKRPYYDVIREQFGSLDRAERRRLQQENEDLRQTLREAQTVMMREMLVNAATSEGEMQVPWRRGPRDGGGNGDRPGRPDRGEGDNREERPERTDEERAERAERMRDHISDRMANGDAQMNQMMREMFQQRREQRAAQGR
jgi:hypothetical protein